MTLPSSCTPHKIINHGDGWFLCLFVGFLSNSELRLHLNASPSWKQVHADGVSYNDSEAISLQETSRDGEEYLGILLKGTQWELDQLNSTKAQIEAILVAHCPDLPLENLRFCFFPQLFLS